MSTIGQTAHLMGRHSRVSRMRVIVILFAATLFAGCAKEEPLPTYLLVSAEQSIAQIRARSADIVSVTGQGSVALKNKTRGAVSLESVFVLRPPGDARVRAWKFGQAVFDLTVKPEGVWLYAPREKTAPGAEPGDLTKAGRGLGEPVRQWIALLLGDLLTGGATATIDGNILLVTRPMDAGATLTTRIDRPTLTIRSQSLVDANGTERFHLNFSKYRRFDSAPETKTLWPSRIEAISATGTITVETNKLAINDVPDTAFTPPSRAVPLP